MLKDALETAAVFRTGQPTASKKKKNKKAKLAGAVCGSVDASVEQYNSKKQRKNKNRLADGAVDGTAANGQPATPPLQAADACTTKTKRKKQGHLHLDATQHVLAGVNQLVAAVGHRNCTKQNDTFRSTPEPWIAAAQCGDAAIVNHSVSNGIMVSQSEGAHGSAASKQTKKRKRHAAQEMVAGDCRDALGKTANENSNAPGSRHQDAKQPRAKASKQHKKKRARLLERQEPQAVAQVITMLQLDGIAPLSQAQNNGEKQQKRRQVVPGAAAAVQTDPAGQDEGHAPVPEAQEQEGTRKKSKKKKKDKVLAGAQQADNAAQPESRAVGGSTEGPSEGLQPASEGPLPITAEHGSGTAPSDAAQHGTSSAPLAAAQQGDDGAKRDTGQCGRVTGPSVDCSFVEIDGVGTAKWEDDLKRTDVKSGRFTSAEKATLIAAVEDYARSNDLPTDDYAWLFSTRKSIQGKAARGAWKAIALKLPHRTMKSVWAFGVRALHPHNYKGPWTEEEDKKLAELVEKHGAGAWRKIGESLERLPEACRDRYRDVVKCDVDGNHKKGSWTKQEALQLQEAVNQYSSCKAKADEESSTSQPVHSRKMQLDGINWVVVAEKVPGRSSMQCMNKWYRTLSASPVDKGEWERSEDKVLLKALQQCLDTSGIQYEFEVPWADLVPGRSGDVTRKRWAAMTKLVTGRQDMELPELLERIITGFCPKLKPALPAAAAAAAT